jgi:hypothetical protein
MLHSRAARAADKRAEFVQRNVCSADPAQCLPAALLPGGAHDGGTQAGLAVLEIVNSLGSSSSDESSTARVQVFTRGTPPRTLWSVLAA